MVWIAAAYFQAVVVTGKCYWLYFCSQLGFGNGYPGLYAELLQRGGRTWGILKRGGGSCKQFGNFKGGGGGRD